MSSIILESDIGTAIVTEIPIRRCGRVLRVRQSDDGPHVWTSAGDAVYVCPGHGDDRYEKAKSGPGYMNELRDGDRPNGWLSQDA